MVTILARSRWTSTSARGSAINWSRVRGIVCHYPAMGRSVGVLSMGQEAARLRGWRSYHVNSLGWKDIGYSYAIGQSGRVYSLRGDRVGGHTYGHNSTTLGVLFIVGDNEPLTAAAKASFRALRATLRHRGASSGVWGHTEMSGNSTRCPGPYIMSSIRNGELKGGLSIPIGGGAGAPRPSVPADDGLSSGLADVDKTQAWLRDLGYDPGPLDGKYGSKTEAATRQAQLDLGITPADGRPGPATRHILEDAVSTLDDIKAIVTQNQVEIRRVPGKVLTTKFPNQGRFSGMTDLATKGGWEADLHAETHQAIAALSREVAAARGEAAGMLEALRAVDTGEPLDLDQVRAAARDGVSQALDSLDADVTLTITDQD